MMRTYSKAISLKTFKERFEYLKIGDFNVWNNRNLNQVFYQKFPEWKRIRRKAIIRDDGFDLGSKEIPILGKIIVHHINPISEKDILNGGPKLLDLENLICCSIDTHNAIHYGDFNLLPSYELVERRPNDTCPWKT